MRKKTEIAAHPEMRRYGITADQIEDAGPTEPAGLSIRLTPGQWQAINGDWQAGRSPFGMADPVAHDVEPERAADLMEGIGGSDMIERRQAAIEPGDIGDDDLVAGPDAEVETVRLANGKSVQVVRGRGANGLALRKPDADDPALRRRPGAGFNSGAIKITRGD